MTFLDVKNEEEGREKMLKCLACRENERVYLGHIIFEHLGKYKVEMWYISMISHIYIYLDRYMKPWRYIFEGHGSWNNERGWHFSLTVYREKKKVRGLKDMPCYSEPYHPWWAKKEDSTKEAIRVLKGKYAIKSGKLSSKEVKRRVRQEPKVPPGFIPKWSLITLKKM